MATTVTINVGEASAYAAALAAGGERVGALVSTVTRKAGNDIERTAKILAPVDTGYLRNSISTSVEGSGHAASITVEVGPTANYGAFVEDGTSRMAPQPYMGPATDRVVPLWQRALEAIATGAV